MELRVQDRPAPAEETCGRCLYFFLREAALRGSTISIGVCRWRGDERGVNVGSEACEAYRPVAKESAARYVAGATVLVVAESPA